MLDIQRKSGDAYVAYLTAKTANEAAKRADEKAMHDKEMEIKEAQLQLLRKQLDTGATARASTPVRS